VNNKRRYYVTSIIIFKNYSAGCWDILGREKTTMMI
jgi:hypothetical protein